MKCEQCTNEKFRSCVYEEQPRASTLTIDPKGTYYDEEGAYHTHQFDKYDFTCSRGHFFRTNHKWICPVEDCSWNNHQEPFLQSVLNANTT